jgi:hypothetical protein
MVRAASAFAYALAPARMPRLRAGAAGLAPKITKPNSLVCRTLSGDDDGIPFGASCRFANATQAIALTMLGDQGLDHPSFVSHS